MENEFLLAVIVAAIVFVLTIALGEEFGTLIKFIGAVVIFLPLFFYLIVGMTGMLNAAPDQTQAIADNTISNLINYVTAKLPGIVISDVAGAFVGAIGGFIVKMFTNN